MWSGDVEERSGVLEVRIRRGERRLSYREVVEAWSEEVRFRTYFGELLADAPFAAYFFEARPVDRGTFDHEFEFVLVDSPALAGLRPDASDFAEHFASAAADQRVIAFDNLGRDARLVVPTPDGSSGHPHLASFVRAAPAPSRHALWRAVAAAVTDRLGPAPLWLSTSGLGVPWLHVRLDSRPKYYTHAPYRTPPA